ncbi:MAG TPA: cytochrome c [Vicinamibacterales bacterium]|nr:cytochrome c [Vicinamibacterales bacterium]
MAQSTQATDVTWAEHVAPILFKNCVTCHRPGEAGPFSLLTYENAKEEAGEIAEATRTKYMPPWKPGPSDFPFAGARGLTDAEIDTVQRWVKAGTPQGDVRKAPKPPSFNDDWSLGKPDLIVKMTEPFTVPADGRDVYRNFVIPLNLKEDKWVKVVDYKPSARPVVHHAIFVTDPTGAARDLDAKDPGPGFGGIMGATGLGGRSPAAMVAAARRGQPLPSQPQNTGRGGGAVGGYVPGGRPTPLRDDLAFFVPRGADLVVATHFHPNGQVMQEQSTFGIYFASRPPSKGFAGIQLPPFVGALKGINIPPGSANYTITDSFVVPSDLLAFRVGAHAHYIGKELRMTATFPDGTKKTLFYIPDWDLNWQGQYDFKDLVALPAGTRLDVSIRYDNSAANPHNPSMPPMRVTFGEQSTNEMGAITLAVIPARPGGLVPLHEAIEKHLRDAVMNSPMLRGRGGR